MGGRPDAAGGAGLAAPRPERQRHLLGRARLAVRVSLAAAPGRPGRDRLRGARAALASDPRRVRRGRLRRRYEIHPGEDIHDGATFERFVDAVGGHAARLHQLRSEPLPAAAARLRRLHRPLPRAHQGLPRQGRGVQPDRAASASMAATRAGSTAPAASARSATGRSISARSSPSSPSTTTIPGRCWNGNAPSSIRRTARARAPSSSTAHIIRVTEKAFDDFAAGGTDEAANRRMLGIDAA